MITGKRLAELLYGEFKEGMWGAIDPYWFKESLNLETKEAHAVALKHVLIRVASKLNEKE
jgi:hypothetical protein